LEYKGFLREESWDVNFPRKREPQVNYLPSACDYTGCSASLGIPEKVRGCGLVGVASKARVDSEQFFFSHQCLNLSPLFLFFSLVLKWDLDPGKDNNILTENCVHRRQGHHIV
jgi:hypothetical protein